MHQLTRLGDVIDIGRPPRDMSCGGLVRQRRMRPTLRLERAHVHQASSQMLETAVGPVCLASDATHYYENFLAGKPFPIVADLQDMLDGFGTLIRLAGGHSRVIPGHDPLVRQYYPQLENVDFAWRLDQGPVVDIPR